MPYILLTIVPKACNQGKTVFSVTLKSERLAHLISAEIEDCTCHNFLRACGHSFGLSPTTMPRSSVYILGLKASEDVQQFSVFDWVTRVSSRPLSTENFAVSRHCLIVSRTRTSAKYIERRTAGMGFPGYSLAFPLLLTFALNRRGSTILLRP